MRTIHLILLSFVLFVSGCRSLPPAAVAAIAHGDIVSWPRDQIVGLQMTLIDPKSVEYYSFGEKGALAVTFGEVGGMCCSPLIGWRYSRGRLFTSDIDGHSLGEEFYLVSMERDSVKLRRATGELVHFKRHQLEE